MAREQKRLRSDTGLSVPPPPGTVSEARARMIVGKNYVLYVRLGQLAEKAKLPWHNVWKAAFRLIEEGHAPRDGIVLDRAREQYRNDQAQLAEIEARANERRNR